MLWCFRAAGEELHVASSTSYLSLLKRPKLSIGMWTLGPSLVGVSPQPKQGAEDPAMGPYIPAGQCTACWMQQGTPPPARLPPVEPLYLTIGLTVWCLWPVLPLCFLVFM